MSWMIFVFFFFKQKTAYEMRISDWSSDVCSSDLWTYAEKVPRKAENAGSGYVPVLDANGFSGGRFETRGLGRERKLVGALNDGSSVEYGHVRFALGDPRSSGTWRSPDGSVALLGTRYYDVPRYGLVRVTSRGGVEELADSGSLTSCDVNDAFTAGVCVRQSMVSPPELVALDPRDGAIRPIVSLAPRYAAIAPLKVVPRIWTNRNGFAAHGFVEIGRAACR